MMTPGFRKGPTLWDGVLITVFIVLTISVAMMMGSPDPGSVLEVKTLTEEVRIPLDRDGRYAVSGPLGTAFVVVEDGGARMESAPCPLKICETMGPVTKSGQTILCLPNRISARVLGKVPVDAVSR
jgi:hypothetical protein